MPKRGAFGAPDSEVCVVRPVTDISCAVAWCAGEPPRNRMSTPDESSDDNAQRMDIEASPTESNTTEPNPYLRWKCGAELVPPLMRENAAAVALVAAILYGTVAEWPTIIISEAVAVLIYRLLLDKQRRAEQFAAATWADVHVVLASLARHERVAPDTAAADRLKAGLARSHCYACTCTVPGYASVLRLDSILR